MSFPNLGLIEPLLRAVTSEGYNHPTPIQIEAIPLLLAGKDLLGCAQTGTGKTAAFALPILQRFYLAEQAAKQAKAAQVAESPAPAEGHAEHAGADYQAVADEHGGRGRSRRGRHGQGEHAEKKEFVRRAARALILTPTRELAAQIGESFATYGKFAHLHHVVIFGGVKQGPQVAAVQRGVDIIVATPGRLLDLMSQGIVHLHNVEVLVLDEADRMLDMGFIQDIRRIVAKVPTERQTMLFSATMPHEIQYLADSVLRHPVQVRIKPEAPAAETVQQFAFMVEKRNKQALLEHVLRDEKVTRALIFTRTRRGADRVELHLNIAKLTCDVIHADKTQGARTRALENFKSGKTPVLIASDIAARGIDIDDISHVINFDVPVDAETYVHRIGRTGRAGNEGTALTFCCMEERAYLSDIEKLVRRDIEVVDNHPFAADLQKLALVTKAAPAVVPQFKAQYGMTRKHPVVGRRKL